MICKTEMREIVFRNVHVWYDIQEVYSGMMMETLLGFVIQREDTNI